MPIRAVRRRQVHSASNDLRIIELFERDRTKGDFPHLVTRIGEPSKHNLFQIFKQAD